ncbi:hypothetical protein D9757_010863 [Collybiopsis confluens]|uniref:Fungal-type protein kinase domain-containing protein n=1 Tax=Collybiopsis confluens TaxID=2823264 RepID=A0A8H5H7I2_9AGAR|nr:hypothetical protein D9757_010863 [Collybiopsis confluens]
MQHYRVYLESSLGRGISTAFVSSYSPILARAGKLCDSEDREKACRTSNYIILRFLQVRWQNDGQLGLYYLAVHASGQLLTKKATATAALDHHVTTKFKRTFSIKCLQLSVVCQNLKRDFEIIRVHFPNDDTKLLRLKRAEQFYLVKLCSGCLPKEHRHNSEHDVILRAQHIARNGHEWALNYIPKISAHFTVPFGKNTSSQRRREEIINKSRRPYKVHAIGVTIFRGHYQYLESLTKPEMLAQVFYDILQVHRWLYTYARIRYHNLDSANIALRCDGDKNTHMVSWVTRTWRLLYRSRIIDQPSSEWRTGSRPFVAYDLLEGTWSKALITPGKMLDHDKLNFKSWISRSIDKEELAREKGNFLALDSDTYPFPIQPFFERFRPWLDAIRECFRFGYAKRSWAANEEEQQTLFGHVTYEKMDNIMGSFNGKLLEKRWPANGQ